MREVIMILLGMFGAAACSFVLGTIWKEGE